MIRECVPADAAAVAEIYNHYIEHTVVSFETKLLTEQEMLERIERIKRTHPWIVMESDGTVAGYAYAGPWHSRAAYQYTCESSIYLDHGQVGKGYGAQLYADLIERLRELNMHCLIGGVALPNPASVALHEKFGFEQIALMRQVGRKFDRWIDVGYWQLLL